MKDNKDKLELLKHINNILETLDASLLELYKIKNKDKYKNYIDLNYLIKSKIIEIKDIKENIILYKDNLKNKITKFKVENLNDLLEIL